MSSSDRPGLGQVEIPLEPRVQYVMSVEARIDLNRVGSSSPVDLQIRAELAAAERSNVTYAIGETHLEGNDIATENAIHLSDIVNLQTTLHSPAQIDIYQTTTYAEAAAMCPAGKELCTRNDICPNGLLQPPFDGNIRGSDVWVPVSDADNSWVSVGNSDAANRLCKTHAESQGSNPSWGALSTAAAYRKIAFCCFNAHYAHQPSANLLHLRRSDVIVFIITVVLSRS